MLAHLRNVHLRSSIPSWRTAIISSRSLSSTSARHQEPVGEDGAVDEEGDSNAFASKDPQFEQWLDTEGKKYATPHRPRNWLGGQPFPLNPSFKPPTPISDQLRTVIYNEYMSNPGEYTVRKLSERHGISMKRIDAILRLKGLEEHWKKNKPLQTGFLAGMEEYLGVTEQHRHRKSELRGSVQGQPELGDDASEADAQADVEGNARARERYQRLFWEPVVEGQEPTIASDLERARLEERNKSRAIEELKGTRAGVPPRKHEERVVEVPGRPTWKFVDVGGKFVDVNDRVRRLKESERRSKLKAQRRQRKEASAKGRREESMAAVV